MTLLTAVIVGVVVGIVIGALGAGGGIIAVPVLTYLLHQPPHDATSGSLVIVAVTALLALPGKAKLKQIKWREGLVFGVLSSVGAIIGRLVNAKLDAKSLLLLFSVLLLAVSGLMIHNALKKRRLENAAVAKAAADSTGAASKAALEEESGEPRGLWWIILAATLTGLLTGLFGVGGGFAVVPVLILVMRFTVREATGTSLVVMIFAACVAMITGVVNSTFHVQWSIILLFIVGSAIGGFIGGPASQKARPSTLAIIFAFLVLAVGVFTFIATLMGVGLH